MVAATSFGAGLTTVVILPLVVGLWNPVPDYRFRLLMLYGAVALATIALYVITLQQQGEVQDNLANKADMLKQSVGNFPVIMRAFAELLAIGGSGLVWGPLMVGKIAVVPKTSLPMVASLAAIFVTLPLLVWGCIASSSAERRRILALLLIPCAAYGLIALARSGGYLVVHAEAPRYHYLPPAVMAIVLCLVLSKLTSRLPAAMRSYGRASYFIWLVLVLVPYALGPEPAGKEGRVNRQNRQFQQSTEALERAIERQSGNEAIYIVNQPFAVFVWGYTPESFPGLAGLFVISYPSNIVDGKRVYFLEESEEIVRMAQAQKGSRIAELIIAKPKSNNP